MDRLIAGASTVGMTTHTHDTMTLVLGGTGKTGARVVQRLAAQGAAVRVGSRSGQPPFDWYDRSTWAPALGGVTAAYVCYYPDLAVPGAADTVGAFADLAVETGVRRLVVLSGRGEPEAQRSERAVMDAGADWTVVRASFFAQNFSEHFLLDAVLGGELALPCGEVAEPFIDAGDIADVAVAALTQDGHAGQVYEVTGPRLLTFADAVAGIAVAARRELRYVPLSRDDFATGLTREGLPADIVSLMTYLFTDVLDGRNAHLSDGVQRALGRQPRDFAEYVRDTAASGVWDA